MMISASKFETGSPECIVAQSAPHKETFINFIHLLIVLGVHKWVIKVSPWILAKQVIVAQIYKNWVLLEISKSCHFKSAIWYSIRWFLVISWQFWQNNPWFLVERYRPVFVGQSGRKYKFQLKSSNIGLLASFETQNSKFYFIN